MAMWRSNRRTKKPFKIPENVIEATREGVKARREVSLPDVVIFDMHGTLDWQNTGVGIPISALVALKQLGKDIRVFTSSGTYKTDNTDVGKLRVILAKYGIPVITDENEAFTGAVSGCVVGDKPSDERRAGRHGYKFMSVKSFELEKFISTRPDFEAEAISKQNQKIVSHWQNQQCTCSVQHPGKKHEKQYCTCTVEHPLTEGGHK